MFCEDLWIVLFDIALGIGLVLYGCSLWCFDKMTGLVYMGDGTFKCPGCGFRGPGRELQIDLPGHMCPKCHGR